MNATATKTDFALFERVFPGRDVPLNFTLDGARFRGIPKGW